MNFSFLLPLIATNLTLNLTWDPSPTAASYNLYWGTNSRAYTWSQAVVSTNASVTNLVRGRTYYFAATAVNEQGQESDYSNEVTNGPVAFTNSVIVHAWLKDRTNVMDPGTNVWELWLTSPPGQRYFGPLGISVTNR